MTLGELIAELEALAEKHSLTADTEVKIGVTTWIKGDDYHCMRDIDDVFVITKSRKGPVAPRTIYLECSTNMTEEAKASLG